MSSGLQFYLTTLLVYGGVDVLACWALNLQFGFTGLLNFAFILFQSVGAYTAAVLTLGPQSGNGGFQHYIIGATLPFPLPMIIAGLVGAVLSLVVGVIALRRLRSDYQAVVMLVVSIMASYVVVNDIALFNGSAGVALVPEPLADRLNLSMIGYQWFYVGITLLICLICYFFLHRLTRSPFGRALRALRDNEAAAMSLGKNVTSFRLLAFCTGGALAALSGALLVQFIGTWAPQAWLYPETFVFMAAVIIGGRANNVGALVGALLVPVGFNEATRFIPQFGPPGLVEALQWIAIGLLIIGFLWFRPQGIIPERPQNLIGAAGAPRRSA